MQLAGFQMNLSPRTLPPLGSAGSMFGAIAILACVYPPIVELATMGFTDGWVTGIGTDHGDHKQPSSRCVVIVVLDSFLVYWSLMLLS